MEILVTGRQAGKTSELMKWVSEGEKCPGYPGWTRVAIAPTMSRFLLLKSKYWGTLEDFDHRVYFYDEIRTGRFPLNDTEYRVDDMEELISQMVFRDINLGGFTITGKLWEN